MKSQTQFNLPDPQDQLPPSNEEAEEAEEIQFTGLNEADINDILFQYIPDVTSDKNQLFKITGFNQK